MLQIMVYLYPSLQWGIGPSSFSHIENCGSKDPIVSFFFRILQRLSIYFVEPFKSMLAFIWPMFLSLFRESTLERAKQQNIEMVKYTKERKTQGFGCEFYLSPTMAIESYWSKCLKGVWGFFQLVVWKISLWWIWVCKAPKDVTIYFSKFVV